MIDRLWSGATLNRIKLKLFACQHLVSLEIFADRLLHDILRQRPVIVRIVLQPVSCELLVKGRLAVSRLISVGRPETGAVRRQHLVADHDIAVLVEAELEFGVGDDNPFA